MTLNITLNITPMDLISGLHSSSSYAFRAKRIDNSNLRHLFNALNVVGWIFLVGAVAGVARLIFTAIMYSSTSGPLNQSDQAFYAVMMMRGVVELCSLGFFFIVSDIIFTIGREIQNAPFENSPFRAVQYKASSR